MADNKRWFKVWNSLLTDPSFGDLPVEQIGRWTLLGALISLHGEKGKITLSKKSLFRLLRIQNDNELVLPNVIFNTPNPDNGNITVIMNNWSKYQLDSTGYERLKRYRNKQNDNGVREEKIREDKEKTKIKKKEYKEYAENETKNILETDRKTFQVAYPGIDLDTETQKALAWLISNPANQKSNIKRFLNNWFSRTQDKKNLYPPKEDKFL
ncbi:MAG: hypothetical protein V1679_00055 [Candidatus Peregrinibacteria bacterium]